jgi:hypothetical protein
MNDEKLFNIYKDLCGLEELDKEKSYCVFAALVGSRWKPGHGLAFYGRVTNGWADADGYRPHRLRGSLNEILDFGVGTSICRSDRKHFPLICKECEEHPATHWIVHRGPYGEKGRVTSYADSLPYWNAVKCVMDPSGLKTDWHSEIMFSQLYKIAPNRWNPTEKLNRAQLELCKEFLYHELSKYRPRGAVFLTEVNPRADPKNWTSDCFEPFMKVLGDEVVWDETPRNPFVRRIGNLNLGDSTCRIVVCVRPESLKRKELAEKIVACLD